jgi:hypothetical protein
MCAPAGASETANARRAALLHPSDRGGDHSSWLTIMRKRNHDLPARICRRRALSGRCRIAGLVGSFYEPAMARAVGWVSVLLQASFMSALFVRRSVRESLQAALSVSTDIGVP